MLRHDCILRSNIGTMLDLSRSQGKRNPMKRNIFIVLLLLGFSTTVVCDYQDEINTLTTRMQELSGSDTGLSDSERFDEIVAMTYEYSMLSYPEFATYLGDPRGQDRWTDQSEAITLQRQQDVKTLRQQRGYFPMVWTCVWPI